MTQQTAFFDALETRSPAERESALFAALPEHIAHAQANTDFYGDLFSAVDPAAITSREALACLPVTRKAALKEVQAQKPPFGGLVARGLPVGRIFQSPGPINEPQGMGDNYWRAARALYAAGFRPGEIVHNSFSYHFTPGGWILDDGARALGCLVFPAGVGQTDQQAQALATMGSHGYCGTPSFLRILIEKCQELGLSHASLTKALVSGEALPPSLREQIRSYGCDVYQAYATADLGVIAYETPAREGLVVDEGVIVEIVRPGTGDPVAPGEVGELLVTTFAREYPLIRFATGDMSAVMDGPSPCGRTNMRIKGWMGRADQTTKIKGMFVHPEQVAEIVKRHREIIKARVIATSDDNRDVMTVRVETTDNTLAVEAVAKSVQEVTKLKAVIDLVLPGSLPNDGKVIDDQRTYE
jgi:phenylacetate-CoA ligase